MIPTVDEAKQLWEKYQVPEQKRIHLTKVAEVAMAIAKHVPVHTTLLNVAALLHDIDKAAPRRPGEVHPDAAVRILREEGFDEVAAVVSTHPLHAILDSAICPKTWEEKILFLADKMVKYDIVGVDKRFDLWRAEKLPPDARKILEEAYPKVKELEQEVFTLAKMNPHDLY